MQKTITVLLIVVGIIHLLPLGGVLGAERLAALYGLSFEEPNLVILMRHRAILFGILGLFFVYAAFQPALQPLAFVAGFISVISFLGIAWSVGGYNEAIRKVILADLLAAACLLAAVILYFIVHRHN
jgi:hypothetical protein